MGAWANVRVRRIGDRAAGDLEELRTALAEAREVRAEVDWAYQPAQFDTVEAPTLLLAGAESPPAQQEATQRAAAALPDARVRTLEGHSHIAHRVDPAMVAAIVCEFVSS